MRLRLMILLVTLCLPTANAFAGPVQYTFTGMFGHASYLQRTDGVVVDLDGADFTATGYAGDPLSAWGSLFFSATTTYDFGALGSFTTDDGGDVYAQLGSAGLITMVGLIAVENAIHVIDGQGFLVPLTTSVALENPAQAQAFETQTMEYLDPLSQHDRLLTNAAGEVLKLGHGLDIDNTLTIRSASVVSVPEPSSVVLLSVGVLTLWRRRRHHG